MSKRRADPGTKHPRERPPSVPEWLWERVQETAAAYDDWAKRSFDSKKEKYLSGEDSPEPEAGEQKVDVPG